MTIRRALLATTMLAGIVGGPYSMMGVAHAADASAAPFYKAAPQPEPAVDGFNAKWEALGGALNKERLYGSRGAISIPLGREVGLQIDGGGGSLGGSGFGTIAPHLFLRNPSQGMIGLYASYTQWNRFGGVHVAQVAGEAEHYFGRWTIQGIAGVEWGNSASNTTVSTLIVPQNGNIPGVINTNFFTEGYDVQTRFFDQINIKYYITDNFAGYIGHRYLGGQNALALGGETAVSLGRGMMASAFVEARLGEHAYNGVWGGLKFYFGQKDKTLMQRHRQDDPPIWDTLHSILNNYNSSSSNVSQQFCQFGPPFNGSCESF